MQNVLGIFLVSDNLYTKGCRADLVTIKHLETQSLIDTPIPALFGIGIDPLEFTPAQETMAPTQEETHVLEHALSQLDADTRAAVILFVVEGVPAKQVAVTVGWDGPKTVYNRVQRALTKLKKSLQPDSIPSA